MKLKDSARALALVAVVALAALPGCRRSVTTGEHGTELTLVKPADQTMAAGDVNEILIVVKRTKFAGPIDIDFDDLPSGIGLKESSLTIAAGDGSRTFTLVADADAEPVEGHRVKVTAEGGDLSVSEFFALTVKPAK